MGLWDVLRGERRQPRSNLDRIFAMSTAALTLEANQSLAPWREAAVAFKPVSSADFARTQGELDELLQASVATTGGGLRTVDDEYGFRWIVVENPELEGLVTTIHFVNQTLQDEGYSEQLLCSVFGFGAAAKPVYFVYTYKRGTFYPFAPSGDHERDNITEMRLQVALDGELPIEPDLERWFPVWGVPLRPPSVDG